MAGFGGGPSAAMVVIIYSIWTSLGYNIVMCLAGLTGIPNEIVEAARSSSKLKAASLTM